ncbi:MAG TPA: hypothetical protein VL371_11020 [Gemmataceae bacterium]|nr:hypothetical protein [Gemmataceae bacterium]
MHPPARVTSIDALRDFRAALATFRSEAIDALAANELDIRRAFDWLTEQRQFWQRAVREMQDEVTHCKAELFRRQTVLPGERVPDCTQQIKALRVAVQKLEHAEDRVKACRRWEPALQRAVDEYQGPARQLGSLLDGDLPKSAALLDRMIASLDAYVAVAPKPANVENDRRVKAAAAPVVTAVEANPSRDESEAQT